MCAGIVVEPVTEFESSGIGRIELECFSDGLTGVVELTGGSEFRRKVDPGVDPGWCGLDGGAEMNDGSVGVATAIEQVAKLPLGWSKVGVEFDGLLELLFFSGEIAGLMKGH